MKWKTGRKERKAAEDEQSAKAKAEAYKAFKAGSKIGMTFSGRELFDFNPDWAKGEDEDDDAMDVYTREEETGDDQEAAEDDQEAAEEDQVLPEVENLTIEESNENEVDEELFGDLDGLDEDEDE